MNKRRFFCFCLHCEHPWEEGDGHFDGELEYCPRPACNGGTEDTRSWDWVRGTNPHYPAVPKCGESYPLARESALC